MQATGLGRVILCAVMLTPGVSLFADVEPETPSGEAKPLEVLLITGGGWHDYVFQSAAIVEEIPRFVPANFTVVNEGGEEADAQIDLYDDPEWSEPYDVVIHNECFADVTDADYIRKITAGHRAGTPAVVIHCAMHCYRAAEVDDWREFLGVTTRYHEHLSEYPVKIVKKDHPVLQGIPSDWVTPTDELYVIEDVGPQTTVLATSRSERSGDAHPVIWVNDYHGTRVFGTTFGHTNDTFSDPVFLRLIAQGLQWAAEKPEKE